MAIAIFSTWTTYGSWLPGDERGWWQRGRGLQLPDLAIEVPRAFARQYQGRMPLMRVGWGMIRPRANASAPPR